MILTDAFVKAYEREGGKKIICNISSGAARKPLSGWGEYCSSKAGLAMFSRVADEELRKQGFRVFSLAPGIVDTDMQSEIRHADERDFPALDRFAAYKSEGLLSTPEEVAEKIFHLIQHPDLFADTVQDVRNF
jgi:benzil reductase ((S)-benzoin forming)